MATPLTNTPTRYIRNIPVHIAPGYNYTALDCIATRAVQNARTAAAAPAKSGKAIEIALAAQSVPITAMQAVTLAGGEPVRAT